VFIYGEKVNGSRVYSNNYNSFKQTYLITHYHYNFCIALDGKVVMDVQLIKIRPVIPVGGL
jgi:hypothetical protein